MLKLKFFTVCRAVRVMIEVVWAGWQGELDVGEVVLCIILHSVSCINIGHKKETIQILRAHLYLWAIFFLVLALALRIIPQLYVLYISALYSVICQKMHCCYISFPPHQLPYPLGCCFLSVLGLGRVRTVSWISMLSKPHGRSSCWLLTK